MVKKLKANLFKSGINLHRHAKWYSFGSYKFSRQGRFQICFAILVYQQQSLPFYACNHSHSTGCFTLMR